MQKTSGTIIPSMTIAAGETTDLTDCTSAIDLSRATSLQLTVKGTFNASATGGMKVYLFSSTDNTTYDDMCWDDHDVPNTRRLGYTSADKMFMIGEVITSQAAGTANVVNWTLDSGTFAGGDAAGDLILEDISGTFTDGQTLSAGTSSCAATQSGSISGHSVVRTLYPTAVGPLYLKARLANEDTGQSITSASLIAVTQTI